MVFRKYFKKAINRVKKNTWYGKRYMSKGGVARLYRDVKWIKGQLNTELKARDTRTNQTMPAAFSWNIANINSLPRGGEHNERNGASVKFKSVQVKGHISLNDGTQQGIVKMVLLIDKEPLPGTSLPALGDVYNTDGYAPGSTAFAMRNWQSVLQKRFTVLATQTFVLDAEHQLKNFTFYKKLNMVSKYSIDDDTNNYPINNRLYLCTFGDVSSPTLISYGWDARVTYIDN